MTALVDCGYISRKKFPFNNFRASDLHFTSQAFGRKPNALPELSNFLRSKRFGSPGRIRTSNISVNSLSIVVAKWGSGYGCQPRRHKIVILIVANGGKMRTKGE
jgi:hypothetical protein